jgi:protein Mpv17
MYTTITDVWQHSWQKVREVYVETFVMDCIVWPPLQLINFTFIPVRFQFLYVNVANLAWNTFLSLMANKSH